MFDFGSNWLAFSEQKVDPQRLAVATRSLCNILQTERLDGRSFLDVGCGSGLFSIAAACLGANPVVGIDILASCIQVSQANAERLMDGNPPGFRQMSILDTSATSSLGASDIVYAWGSLHHTGAMWQAIEETMQLVKPRGTLVLSIYNRHVTSPVWHFIKRVFNKLPSWGQRVLVPLFGFLIMAAKFAVTRRNPLAKERGMDFWFDVVDWLGGYPYEYASADEIKSFLLQRGFTLQRCMPASVPTGCNEFVFLRPDHREPDLSPG